MKAHYDDLNDAFRDARRNAMGCDAYCQQINGVVVFFRDISPMPTPKYTTQAFHPDPNGQGYHAGPPEMHDGFVPEYAVTLYRETT